MGAATGTSQSVIGAESAKTQLTGFPTLKPAFNLKINVNANVPGPVGPTSAGSELIHWICPSGKLTTVEGFEPKIEADVIFGADWLYFDNDKKFARPNVKAVAKTPEGQTLTIEYDGIATLAQEFVDIFAGKPDAKTIPFGLSVTEHRFQAGAPELKFLENHKWIGNGRIVVGEDAQGGRTVTVESRISQVVPSTVMD